MKHLDEGTIHAWLDGALDSTQGREIETHVAQCATCSAAVAEARGFVAGASRILNALDDVPANVVPKRAPAPPTARRQWRAAPWVTGIAAALILAIGVTQVSRKGAQENVFMPATTSAILADSAAVMAESPTAAPVAPVQPPPPTQTSRVQSPPTAEGRVAAAAERQQRRDLPRDEKQSSPSQGLPAVPSQRLQSALSQQKLEEVVVTGTRDAMKSAPPYDAGADAKAQVERLAGCYRLDAPTSVIMPAAPPSVGNVTGAAVQRAAKARAQVSEATATASFAAAKVPGAVRLDTVLHPIGFLVRAERSDSVLGSWRIAGDSARLDLASGSRFVVTQNQRVSCPER